jgi:hypothetical protein
MGVERTVALWREVAARAGVVFDGDAILAEGRHARLRLERRPTGRRTLAVVATYTFAETGLDLHLEAHATSGGGRSEWMRARDPSQAGRFLGPLRPFIDDAPAGRLDDGSLVVEASHAGDEYERLAQTLKTALELGRVLDAQLAAVPPPTALEASLDVWVDLATSLGAALRRGDLRLDVPLGARGAVVAPTFGRGGRPLGTRLELRLDAPLSVPAFATVDAVPAGWRAPAVAEARALLALPERARLWFERDVFRLVLNTVVVDPHHADRVRDVLFALDRLARVLRPSGSAYR